jgi:hypothetical protein
MVPPAPPLVEAGSGDECAQSAKRAKINSKILFVVDRCAP